MRVVFGLHTQISHSVDHHNGFDTNLKIVFLSLYLSLPNISPSHNANHQNIESWMIVNSAHNTLVATDYSVHQLEHRNVYTPFYVRGFVCA